MPDSQGEQSYMEKIQHHPPRRGRVLTHDIRITLWRSHRRQLLAEWNAEDLRYWHALAEAGRRRGILRPLPRRRSA
jgi:hypothetical protein